MPGVLFAAEASVHPKNRAARAWEVILMALDNPIAIVTSA